MNKWWQCGEGIKQRRRPKGWIRDDKQAMTTTATRDDKQDGDWRMERMEDADLP